MSPTRIQGDGRRILVIDDDLAIRVLLQAVLKRLDFVVELAEDGEAGLAMLASRQYDLILLDLMMPKVNGYEFIERAQALDGVAKHIIVFTAAGQRGVDRIRPDSVCDAILKPFDLEKFLELIERCIEGHEKGRPPEARAAPSS
ncbi:MAG: response regulator [Thermoanaerobaculia bacterium]